MTTPPATSSPDAATRLASILAAGRARRPVLLFAAPGAGGTMLARRLAGACPGPSEAREAGRAAAAAAGLESDGRPPFRAPHHTCSDAGLVGARVARGEYVMRAGRTERLPEAGPSYRPGEVHLAAGGALLLDELPEFGLGALEALAAAVRGLGQFRPWIIARANPCPCGFAGSDRSCVCPDRAHESWTARISKLSAILGFAPSDTHVLDRATTGAMIKLLGGAS